MDAILIVDDEKDNLEALKRLLRNDFDLTLETSPFDALKQAQRREFAVIVSDQRMPEMTGVELLEKIKQIAPLTTRILLTGYTDMEAVVGAINRGQIYRYVAKPWDPDELKLTLRQAAEAFRLKRELELKNLALTKSNEELKLALESLTTLDRAKARFLSLVSHELNTPLTVLVSFVGMLREREKQFPDDIRKAITSLAGATDRFGEIIGEILLYVRLEGENKLQRQAFDLKRETERLVAALEPSLASRGTKFKVTSEAAVVQADPEKMRIALKKLLVDTAERAPKNDTIHIAIRSLGDRVEYAVSRKGEPLSPDAVSALSPGSNEMHHHRNLGMALAIAKFVAEAHGGELTVDAGARQGATVRLHLRS